MTSAFRTLGACMRQAQKSQAGLFNGEATKVELHTSFITRLVTSGEEQCIPFTMHKLRIHEAQPPLSCAHRSSLPDGFPASGCTTGMTGSNLKSLQRLWYSAHCTSCFLVAGALHHTRVLPWLQLHAFHMTHGSVQNHNNRSCLLASKSRISWWSLSLSSTLTMPAFVCISSPV